MTEKDFIYYDKEGNVVQPEIVQTNRTMRIVAYLFIAIGTTLGVWFVGHNSAQELKDSINDVVEQGCLASRSPNSTISKYNDFLDDQIQTNKDARVINLKQGATARAQINTDAINRYMKDKAHIPTVKECNVPALK